jgi:hypothetical protein
MPPGGGNMACRLTLVLAGAVVVALLAFPAYADDADLQSQVLELKKQVAAQQKLITQQQKQLDTISHQLQTRNQAGLALMGPAALAKTSGAGKPGVMTSLPGQQDQNQTTNSGDTGLPVDTAQAQPQAPVGQPPAPEEQKERPEIPAIALQNAGGVLTPKGVLTIQPTFEYDNAQVNKFFFAGTEIVNAVFIGALEANNARQNTLTGTMIGRYGILNDLEANLNIPYVYRFDRVATGPANSTINTSLYGHDIGDVEGGLHYQINHPAEGNPYYIANLRVKSNTGTDPFQVSYTPLGSQKFLPTGTGAWTVDPSVTVLFPSDPVVFYGNLGYAHNFAYNPDFTVPTVGKFTFVQPGDMFHGSFGLGFGINDKATMSLGYEHDWVQSTTSTINGAKTLSEELQMGQFNIGASYALSPRISLNANVVIGATRDAPDARIIFSVPISFGIAN